MRTSNRLPAGIVALFLLAVFAVPATARADSDEVKTIGNQTPPLVVRIIVRGGKTFIAVKSGGPLILKYSDGKEMASVPNGTAMMVSGLTGAPTVDGDSLKLAPLIPSQNGMGTEFSVAVSSKSRTALTCNGPYTDQTRFTVNPGNSTRVQLSYSIRDVRLKPKGKIYRIATFNSAAYSDQEIAGDDRDQLSYAGG